jgi:hypothetical protein
LAPKKANDNAETLSAQSFAEIGLGRTEARPYNGPLAIGHRA